MLNRSAMLKFIKVIVYVNRAECMWENWRNSMKTVMIWSVDETVEKRDKLISLHNFVEPKS